VNKKWLQEEEKEQRKKHEEEGDAKNKGIYSLVVKFNRDSSIEILKLLYGIPLKAIFRWFCYFTHSLETFLIVSSPF